MNGPAQRVDPRRTRLKLLVVAPYFPPRRRVGALRPYRFVTRFLDAGVAVRVIRLHTADAALSQDEQARLSGAACWDIAAPFDRTRRRSESELAPAPRTDHPRLLRRALDWTADQIDASCPADTWGPLLTLEARGMLQRARAFAPDMIWATADPWSSLGLGHYLAGELGIPWVADLRDPWTLCPLRAGERTAFGRAADRWLERSWLSSAAAIGFTSLTTRERYALAYPALSQRMFCEPNSYDVDFDEAAFAAAASKRPHAQGAALDVLFFGAFRSSAPATLVVDALALLVQSHGAAAPRVRVRSVGGLPPRDAARATRYGVAGCFENERAVPYASAMTSLRGADLLLLTTADQRPEMIPAKLWDYLAAGRPILSLSRNPEIARVLRDTGLGVQLDPTAPGAVQALATLLCEATLRVGRGEPPLLSFSPRASAVRRYGADASAARMLARFDVIVARRAHDPTPYSTANRSRGWTPPGPPYERLAAWNKWRMRGREPSGQ